MDVGVLAATVYVAVVGVAVYGDDGPVARLLRCLCYLLASLPRMCWQWLPPFRLSAPHLCCAVVAISSVVGIAVFMLVYVLVSVVGRLVVVVVCVMLPLFSLPESA